MADSTDQSDEVLALQAIYGENCEFDAATNSVRLFIPNKTASDRVMLIATMPRDYPSMSAPHALLDAPTITREAKQVAVEEMRSMFCPGGVVLFAWGEYLKEQYDCVWGLAAGEQAPEADLGRVPEPGVAEAAGGDMELGRLGRDVEPDEALVAAVRPRIVTGEAVVERKSTFQAHVCGVASLAEVGAAMTVLLGNNKIANATHNIMAYRITACESAGTFLQDHDDDGEAAAGGRLLHMLQAADVRNVVVVVSRWFGGVLLGPSRFAWINNTARDLLQQEGYISAKSDARSGKKAPSRAS